MPKKTPASALSEYEKKRDFAKTPEPSGKTARRSKGAPLRFVIQKHAASHLHYDLRLEMDGVMRSWAVPKGPSLDPQVKRLAMEVEDHPIAYNDFEGTIPKGEYGGGTVMLWDRGTYVSDEMEPGDTVEKAILRGYHKGKLSITLDGDRLQGSFALVRTDTVKGGIRSKWLFFKHQDRWADRKVDITEEIATSVVSGRTMKEIAAGKGGSDVWHSNRSNPLVGGPGKSSGGRSASRASTKRSEPRLDLKSLAPMLAKSASAAPSAGDWIFEPKYDGIRILGLASGDSVLLITRNGHDKSRQFPEIASALKALVRETGQAVVVDGEIVAVVGGKVGRFESLQGRMHLQDSALVRQQRGSTPAALIAFDLLVAGNEPLVQAPWRERRARLEELFGEHLSETLRLSEVSEDADALIDQGEREGWEGIMAKRPDSRYKPGVRTPDWLKIKLENQQELVVGGWTEPRKSRAHFGALLLGYYDAAGDFIYAGHTGTGFSGARLQEISRRLKPLERRTSPFTTKPKTNEPAHWVEPQLVVEVRFNEWTKEGKLRQPVFVGLREDKDPRQVVREKGALPATAEAETREDSAPSNGSGRRNSAKASASESRDKSREKRSAAESSDPSSGEKDQDALSPRKRVTASSRAEGDETSSAGRWGERAAAKASAPERAGAPRAAETEDGGHDGGDGARSPAGVRGVSASAGRRSILPADSPIVKRLREIQAGTGDGQIQVPGEAPLQLTSLRKVFFPETGHTKGDVFVYYARMGKVIVPWMADRPLVLKRFPNGVEKEAFYQQAAPDAPPEGVRVEKLKWEGKLQPRLVGGNLTTLLYTVQLGAISFDPWHSRVGTMETPDYTILDLDPGPGATFQDVIEVAGYVKEEMDAFGFHGGLKTSGSRGLHVYLPLPPGTPLEAATLVAQIIATRVSQKHPQIATIERFTKNRPEGTIYVDYLQNILGKTVAGVYAVRAKSRPTVSTPLSWSELGDKLDLGAFTVDTVPDRFAKVGDLWGPAMAEPNNLESLTSRKRKA